MQVPLKKYYPLSMKSIFISYSHKDAIWKKRLENHLQVLQHCSCVIWSDEQIAPGDIWLSKIENAISDAQIAILMISPNFFSSKFINEKEIPDLFLKYQTTGLKIIPIIVSHCAWEIHPFIGSIQGGVEGNVPLDLIRGVPQQNKVLSNFTKKIYELLETEKREAEKREAEKREAEKREAEKREADKREADKREADKREADKREADKREADKREAKKVKKPDYPPWLSLLIIIIGICMIVAIESSEDFLEISYDDKTVKISEKVFFVRNPEEKSTLCEIFSEINKRKDKKYRLPTRYEYKKLSQSGFDFSNAAEYEVTCTKEKSNDKECVYNVDECKGNFSFAMTDYLKKGSEVSDLSFTVQEAPEPISQTGYRLVYSD